MRKEEKITSVTRKKRKRGLFRKRAYTGFVLGLLLVPTLFYIKYNRSSAQSLHHKKSYLDIQEYSSNFKTNLSEVSNPTNNYNKSDNKSDPSDSTFNIDNESASSSTVINEANDTTVELNEKDTHSEETSVELDGNATNVKDTGIELDTSKENVTEDESLSYLACTDHAPITSNHYTSWDNKEWECVPKEIQGVRLLRGVEADILDFKGSFGIPSDTLRLLDIVLAALHTYCIQPSDRIVHTEAYEAILCNPYVDILAHPGETSFPFDEAYIMKLAAKEGKAIEINGLSQKNDSVSIKNQRKLVELAMKYGTLLAISSDAQNPSAIGDFDTLPLLLLELCVPNELVINSSVSGLEHFLNSRKRIKSQ